MLEWIKFIIGAAFIITGIIVAIVATFGVFRFKFVLNHMHAAAMGDTLALASVLLGLIIINGFCMASLKLLLIILFLWFASPVSSHLIARLEVVTDEHIDEECEVTK